MNQSLRQVIFQLICSILYFIYVNDANVEGCSDYSKSNILSLMKQYGNNQKKTEGKGNANQYIVVTMLTAAELDKAEKWKMDEILALVKEDRLKIFFNQRDANAEEPETMHGEIIFIYFDEDYSVDALKKRLPVKGQDGVSGNPYLILYSYYIPCACIPNCSFNCAEELGNLARLHSKDMNTIVGYSAVFPNTDSYSSEIFMKEGGVSFFREISEKYEQVVLKQVITDTNDKPMKGTLQELFRQCLIESPVSSCTTKDTNIKEQIVTAFINSIMLPYFRTSKFFGKLTKWSKPFLQKHVESKLDENIKKVSCDEMPNVLECKFLIKACFESALGQTERLAYPTFGAIRHDTPIGDSVTWCDAEALSRGFYLDTFVEVPDCEQRFHSITSLCLDKARFKKGKNGINKLPDRTAHYFNAEERERLRGASGSRQKTTSQKTGQFKQKQGESSHREL